MKIKTLFTLLVLSLFNIEFSFAQQNEFALKGGFSAGGAQITTPSDIEDRFFVGGLITHYGYRATKWEFNIFSNILLGQIENAQLLAYNTQARGEGTLRVLTIGPQLKYISEIRPSNKFKNYNLYGSLAPLWGVKAIYLDNPEGNIDNKKKFVYNSAGFSFSIGAEDIIKKNKEFPIFVELQYIYLYSYKVSLVDYSDTLYTKTLSTQNAHKDTRLQAILLNFGVTFI